MPLSLNADSFKNSDTVSQQLTDSFNGASSSVASGIGGLQSAASGVLGSVSAIGSKLGSAGLAGLTAGKQALDQLGSFTTVSKFTENMKSPGNILSLSPESTKNKTTDGAKRLQYPKDLGKYSISFTFQQTFKENALAPKRASSTAVISLPMPSDLVDKFNTSYSSKDLGFLGKIGMDVYQNAEAGGFSKEAMKSAGEQLGAKVTPTNAYAAARTVLSDSSLAAAADRATGTTLNPFTALQFQTVNLRKHSFKYKFSPNSPEESKALKDIILEFKQRMLPEKNGLLFLFPDTCVIKFNTPNMPYSFKTCYLESFSVNYAPSGVPSFFKNGTDATEVEITLEFGETEPVTRDDMKGNGDITGSGKPYESGSSEKISYSSSVAVAKDGSTITPSAGVKKYMQWDPNTKKYETVWTAP